MMWMEFECETSLIAKTPETFSCGLQGLTSVFLWFAGAYQIFERMTSFFFTFFLGSSVGHIVFGETDPLQREGGTRCPQAVGRANAALPPKFDIEQGFAGNAQKILRIRRLVSASSPKAFGADPLQRSRTNGSMTHRQSSAFAHKPAATGFSQM